ncbi:hypothetical protein [Streptomyces chrestomyceticus]|uniref:hypothetical protein n=1 Tax=Streptomyces chrestomyceticus TaxID=68185 RepID=UPI0019CFDB77|nr:hypothetical protein [Streptomyces chrestomyceticus]
MSCTRTSSRARALRSRPWPGSGARSSALRMRTVTCTPPVCGLPNPAGPQQQAQAFASVGGLYDVVAVLCEQRAQRRREGVVVLNHQQPAHGPLFLGPRRSAGPS